MAFSRLVTLRGWFARVILLWLGLAPTVSVQAAEVERRLGLMGTDASIQISAATREQALAASEAAVRALEETERRLSTWTPHSELSRLNSAPVGVRYAVSTTLAAELVAARKCALDTNGAFDPTIGSLVAAWDLRGNGRVPGTAALAAAVAQVDAHAYEVSGATVLKKAPIRFEEGAFGKGAGIVQALAGLQSQPVTDAVLNLGGQVFSLHGTVVSLAHPNNRGESILRLRLPAGSFATSGNSEHKKIIDGLTFGHLLDPRTGNPVEDFGSLGVWSPDPFLADCLSTALYVMGPVEAIRWAAARENIALVILEPMADGKRITLWISPSLAEQIEWMAPGVVRGSQGE